MGLVKLNLFFSSIRQEVAEIWPNFPEKCLEFLRETFENPLKNHWLTYQMDADKKKQEQKFYPLLDIIKCRVSYFKRAIFGNLQLLVQKLKNPCYNSNEDF